MIWGKCDGLAGEHGEMHGKREALFWVLRPQTPVENAGKNRKLQLKGEV